MLTLCRSLLRLYPAQYREQFGDEMFAVLLDVRAEAPNRTLVARGKFYLREIAGLMSGALREHMRILTDAHVELSLSTGRCDMRNGFRFPKSTIVFMTLILGGVLTAIKKGEDIATSVPQDIGPVGPIHIHSVHPILLGGMPIFFAVFYAAGLIGWAILFALRRSGVHRLADLSEQK